MVDLGFISGFSFASPGNFIDKIGFSFGRYFSQAHFYFKFKGACPCTPQGDSFSAECENGASQEQKQPENLLIQYRKWLAWLRVLTNSSHATPTNSLPSEEHLRQGSLRVCCPSRLDVLDSSLAAPRSIRNRSQQCSRCRRSMHGTMPTRALRRGGRALLLVEEAPHSPLSLQSSLSLHPQRHHELVRRELSSF